MKSIALGALALMLAADAQAFDREATLRWFGEHQFGVTPVGRPADETFGERSVSFFGGKMKIDITCVLPEGADAAHPVPVFLFGDHTGGKAPDFRPGEYEGIPTNAIVSRGYAYVRWNFNDLALNVSAHSGLWRWPCGVIAHLAMGDRDATNVVRRATDWGTLGAWAWGHSRVMDWIETRPELDATRVAVVGHSRGGKTALWAGAQDTRFAMVVANGSGCGGAKLARLGLEKAEKVKDILGNFPNWFCPAFREWIDRDAEITHDADDLLRLIAPRLLYVASGSEDAWAGPAAEKAAWEAAHDVWKTAGLEANMGYHVHEGKHKLRADDWERFLDFADARGWRRPARGPAAAAGRAVQPGKVQVEWSAAEGEKWTVEGFADREKGRPMARDTMFSVQSNTKTVTAALVLTFVEEGKLSLDDPVAKYFPGFDGRVTIRHLLAHTSGLPYSADPKRNSDAVPLAEQVAIAAQRGVSYEPGSKYRYCGLGFSVAAAILEKVSGRPFEALMKERIFDPLGMTDATFRPTKEQQARQAILYYYPPDGGEPVPCGLNPKATHPLESPARVPAAAAGLYATAGDFLRFSQMIALKGVGANGRRILSERMFDEEFLRRQTPPGEPENKSFDIAFYEDGVSGHKGGAYGTHCTWNWGEKSCAVTFVAKAPRPPKNAKAAIDATGFDGGRATFACSDLSRRGDVVRVKVANVDDRHGANTVVLKSGGKAVASRRVELGIGESTTLRFRVAGLAADAALAAEVEK